MTENALAAFGGFAEIANRVEESQAEMPKQSADAGSVRQYMNLCRAGAEQKGADRKTKFAWTFGPKDDMTQRLVPSDAVWAVQAHPDSPDCLQWGVFGFDKDIGEDGKQKNRPGAKPKYKKAKVFDAPPIDLELENNTPNTAVFYTVICVECKSDPSLVGSIVHGTESRKTARGFTDMCHAVRARATEFAVALKSDEARAAEIMSTFSPQVRFEWETVDIGGYRINRPMLVHEGWGSTVIDGDALDKAAEGAQDEDTAAEAEAEPAKPAKRASKARPKRK